ncbi:MAG: extensin family protein, partial [Xanthobacteraceae bacterium]
DFDSYECRGRNRVRGATLSEHGRANALDVRALRLANGQDVALTDVKVAKDFRDAIRASACARFSTVLGPGSDGSHEEHIHLDLAERRGGYKLCEWDVREPIAQAQETAPPGDAQETAPLPPDTVPLPRPRPLVNAAEDSSKAPSGQSGRR